MTANTIIYLTDNTLREPLAGLCQRLLVREAQDIPIISVSQKPIDLGRNICLGEIGRSWYSLYRQIQAGLDAVETANVVIAEHDCLYTHEHLSWQPPDAGVFYYNYNHWLAEGPGGNHPELFGMYSHWPRRSALSQMVCNADLFRQSNAEVMRLLEMGLEIRRGLHWYGEPGVMIDQLRRAFVEASSGRPTQLQRYLNDYVSRYDYRGFATEKPNIDIRHGGNFTGPKRGKSRCYDLPYWGTFSAVMDGTWKPPQC